MAEKETGFSATFRKSKAECVWSFRTSRFAFGWILKKGYSPSWPEEPKETSGFVAGNPTSPGGWINADYIVINPAWYVTEKKTTVYA